MTLLKLDVVLLAALSCSLQSLAQIPSDTISPVQLKEISVKAFELNRPLGDIPAPLAVIDRSRLAQFGPASVVLAMNTVPGLRMEERSPGSYRISIRGSSLRSPFGVRNVKVYYNDLPFTHPGGHTYINQLGNYNFGGLEVLKGPSGSLYGAGTGGALLIDHLSSDDRPGITAEYTAGSYGLHNIYGEVVTGPPGQRNKIGLQHQQSEGYREHSSLRKDILTWTGNYTIKSAALKTTILLSNIQYRTPGALTAAEFEKDPQAARPGSSIFPGAIAAGAAVYQQTVLAGASYTQRLTDRLQSKMLVYGAYTHLENPAIQNYGRVSEPHFGTRLTLKYAQPLGTAKLNIDAGTELQQGFTSGSVFQNKNGKADSLRQEYRVRNRTILFFMQGTLTLQNWTFVASSGLNTFSIRYQPHYPLSAPTQQRTLNDVLTQRFAVLYKWKNVGAFASAARGFSPPVTEELFPSGGDANPALRAEDGTSYDLGLRGKIRKLEFDITAFLFSLENTIVQRRTAGGGSYFINAGKTAHKGLETALTYRLPGFRGFIRMGSIWMSHTWNGFSYERFIRDTTDFSGKNLPGVPSHALAAGIDLTSRPGFSGGLSYFYSDRIPLNDANNVYADEYHLLGGRLGYSHTFRTFDAALYLGADNLLDVRYSLGNDINGFGGRYFNAAPVRNFYLRLVFGFKR